MVVFLKLNREPTWPRYFDLVSVSSGGDLIQQQMFLDSSGKGIDVSFGFGGVERIDPADFIGCCVQVIEMEGRDP